MKLNKLKISILLAIIAFAILLFPFKQSQFLDLNRFIYWVSSYPLIILNFWILLYLAYASKQVKYKIFWMIIFLAYLPLIFYFSRVETEWWHMYDTAPSDELHQELVFKFYNSSYFIAILPFFTLGYILFLKVKDRVKAIF